MRCPGLFLPGILLLLALACGPRVQAADPPTLEHLAAQIRSTDADQRISAVRELARMNTLAALKAALLAAYDIDERVRYELERALVAISEPQALAWLASEGIHHPDKWVRFYCANGMLLGRGAAGVAPVAATLASNYPEVQILILDRLASPGLAAALADEKVVDAVAPVLSPGMAPRAWTKAVQVLSQASTPRAAEVLIAALETKAEWPPRALVAVVQDGLARMHGPGLAARVATALKSAKSPEARAGALIALGACGEDAGLQAIGAFLKEEKDPTLRSAAISALGRCELATATPLLVELAGSSDAADAMMAASVLQERPAAADLTPLKSVADNTATDYRVRGLIAEPLRRATGNLDTLDSPLNAEEVRAVRRAMAWLVRNQEADGHWSTAAHNPWHGKHDFGGLYLADSDDYLDVATTGWCLLALVANREHGHKTAYSESARRAAAWLIAHQQPNGMFKSEKEPQPPAGGSPDFPNQAQHIWAMNHLVATLAVLEFSSQTIRAWKDETRGKLPDDLKKLDDAVHQAVRAIPAKPLEGEYNFFNPKLVNMSRVALISAIRYAYLKRATAIESTAEFDGGVLKMTLESLNKIVESGTTIKVPFDRNGNYWFRSYASSAQAISSGIYLTPKDGKVGGANIHLFIAQRMDLLHGHKAAWEPFFAINGPTGHPPAGEPDVPPSPVTSSYTGLSLAPGAWKDDVVNFEYWLWGTNSAFVVGEDDWIRWKDALMPVLLRHQTVVGKDYGSYEPEGPHERVWGRCFSTAAAALILAMPKRAMNMHTVTWTRQVPPRGFSNPTNKTDDKSGGKGGKMEHPGMEHPGKKDEEKK